PRPSLAKTYAGTKGHDRAKEADSWAIPRVDRWRLAGGRLADSAAGKVTDHYSRSTPRSERRDNNAEGGIPNAEVKKKTGIWGVLVTARGSCRGGLVVLSG